MEWVTDTPKPGDMVRVKVKFYHHYGIFIDEATVVQFGLPDNSGTEPEDIAVLTTDIPTFLAGGFLETAKLDRRERSLRRNPEETAAYALSKVGTKGYHILNNNCEHFANECLFREARSSFVEDVRAKIREKLQKK